VLTLLRLVLLRGRWRLGIAFFAFRLVLSAFMLWRRRRARQAVARA